MTPSSLLLPPKSPGGARPALVVVRAGADLGRKSPPAGIRALTAELLT